jgi:hypothetical protein
MEHAVIQDPNTRTKTCIHRQSYGRRLGQGQAATVARRNLSATEARRPARHYPPSLRAWHVVGAPRRGFLSSVR